MNLQEALTFKNKFSNDYIKSKTGTTQLFEQFNHFNKIGDREDIVGVGIAKKDDNYFAKIYTKSNEKLNIDFICENYKIETENEVGFQNIGELKEFTRTKRFPTPPGWSVSHPQVTAGTLGVWVKVDAKHYILSNNHVLANCNNAIRNRDIILQPGTMDGGILGRDGIGTLSDFETIDFLGTNAMDAAIAYCDPNHVLLPIPNIGHITQVAQAQIADKVEKYGRTTEYTKGEVIDVSADLVININGRPAVFVDQIVIKSHDRNPFSQGGDSGSLIVNEIEKKGVGLLFAGSDETGITIANHLQPVLDRFNASLA